MSLRELDNRTAITFTFERIRAVATGIIETASNTFLLLIAVKWFEAGNTAKGVIAAAPSIGYILSPAVVMIVGLVGICNTSAISIFFFISALGYLLTAVAGSLSWFVLGGVVGMMASSMATPLLTHMFQQNYPDSIRGKLFSRSVMIRIAVAAVFSHIAGWYLEGQLGSYPFLMGVFFFAACLSGICAFSVPGSPLASAHSLNPLAGLRHVAADAVLRNTLIAWMLLGFGNLMMRPLRIEYLANSRYGLDLTVTEIAILAGVVPNLSRFVMSPIWGGLFDRVNFFLLRITLNMGFTVGILSFFVSDSMTGLVFAAAMFGVAEAGGDIAWSLWVTKFAPPQHVAEYMGIHSFFTGVRGILAPFLGFWLAEHLPLHVMAFFCASLIVMASLLLIPEYRAQKSRKVV